MKKQFVLEGPEEFDFKVFAINSHAKEYRLCWNINKQLKMDFAKKEDYKIQENLYFSRYNYICEQGTEHNIFRNQSKNGYLIPEHKNINYFLVADKGLDNEELVKKLNNVKDIKIYKGKLNEIAIIKKNN